MKLAIIGAAGTLGSSTVFCVGQKGLVDEIKLIDIKRNIVETHAMDLYQGLLDDTHTKFTLADYSDIADCDILVITASVPYNSNVKDRSVNLVKNYKIVQSICEEMKPYRKPGSFIITSTNPLEAMINAYYKLLGEERNKFIGFCANDTIRMKWAIEEITGISYSDIKAFCVGEHGHAIRLYDQATVSGEPLVLTDDQKAQVDKMNVEWFAHWQSLEGGRTTGWTSSTHIAKIVEAIVNDSKVIMPAAAVLDGEFGCREVAMDMICTIGANGIEEIIDPNFTSEQMEALAVTAEKLRAQEASIGL